MRGQSNKVQPVLRAAVVLSMREKGQLTELMPYNFLHINGLCVRLGVPASLCTFQIFANCQFCGAHALKWICFALVYMQLDLNC